MAAAHNLEAVLPRYNIYTVVHKALRAMMSDTLAVVGRMDLKDTCERAEAVNRVRELLGVCLSHLKHENEFVHPALEKALPTSSRGTGDDHAHHEEEIADLYALVNTFDNASDLDRVQLGHQLYLELTRFVGDNFQHMAVEETENHAVLASFYSDLEILMIEGALVATIPPEEMGVWLKWMLKAMNAAERAFLLRGMREAAPPPVFKGAMELARVHLSDRDFYKLEAALS